MDNRESPPSGSATVPRPSARWRRTLLCLTIATASCAGLIALVWTQGDLHVVLRRDLSLLLAGVTAVGLTIWLSRWPLRWQILATLAGWLGVTALGISYLQYRQAHGFAHSELRVETFARYPQVANPAGLAIDGHNRLYVVESYNFVDQPLLYSEAWLACQTVADGRRLQAATGDPPPATRGERVVRVEDRDGDGRADTFTPFTDELPLDDGLAASIVLRGPEAWLTCAPHLWKLLDADQDGRAESRTSLHQGFGVRRQTMGHDLQGATIGPDGWLYFAMGDRGLNVPLPEGRRLVQIESGAVLRCRPDGSGLELFATGLRNPRDLVFDHLGNLWTGDNDSNFGDRSRWVYVVEGGDSGWRVGYQYFGRHESPFIVEGIGDAEANVPHRVPAAGHVASGPAGAIFHPGVAALPERLQGKFLLANFPLNVLAFGVRPQGAGYRLTEVETLIDSVLATDLAVGADGKLYIADWVSGWQRPDQGRILRAYDPVAAGAPDIQQTAALLAAGMQQREAGELIARLNHADQRVRQAAQFELAARGPSVLESLVASVQPGRLRLGRIHACWAIGQIAERERDALAPLVPLLSDTDAEVRAQVAKTLGDSRFAAAQPGLVAALADPELRVRFFAAQALGKLDRTDACEPLLRAVETDATQDPYLRHAVTLALVRLEDMPFLQAAVRRPSVSGRLTALLALRRLKRPEIVEFLADSDAGLVEEAIRAIHDEPIDEGLARIASQLDHRELTFAAARRVVNANLRLGTPTAAETLARLAARAALAPEIRLAALQTLAAWGSSSARDPVLGCYRRPPTRNARDAAAALQPQFAEVLKQAPTDVSRAATEAAQALGMAELAPTLAALVENEEADGELRAGALRTLAGLQGARWAELTPQASESSCLPLRREAVALLGRAQLPDALARIQQAAGEDQPLSIRQAAFRAASDLPTTVVGDWLTEQVASAGSSTPGLQLELLEAARVHRSDAKVAEAAAALRQRTANDPLARWTPALAGGDPARGRTLFERQGCVRCHRVDGAGGEVGPDLARLPKDVLRRQLLESIVLPNAALAEGYRQTTLQLADGSMVTGRVAAEDAQSVTLILSTGQRRSVTLSAIEERAPAQSAMPANYGDLLSLHELRDLVEFLEHCARRQADAQNAGLKTPAE